MEKQKCPMLAVSGVKNSGKTTFLERILPLLSERGVKTAVIKHDGHSFEPDVEGTDSYRMRRAGAAATAVYCDTHYMLVENRQVDYETLAEQIRDVDLILVEGAKNSPLPKIELVRTACSAKPVCDKRTVLAVATDSIGDFGVRKIGFEDYGTAVDLICDYIKENRT